MSRQQTVLRGLAVAGAGAAVAAVARRGAKRAAADFYSSPVEATEPRWLGAGYGGAPFVFHRSDSIQALHGASFDAVREALPSAELHPVRLPDGRAIVLIVAAQHGDVTAGGVDGIALRPYGEVIVAAAVTRRRAPRFVPLMAPPASGIAAGWFVLHLPVTSRVARDVGRLVWGYPKFVADMEFEAGDVERGVRLAEAGHEILRLTVRPSGPASVYRSPLILYSVLDGELIELSTPTVGLRQARWGSKNGHLELGDHQVADELRALSIAPEPFMTISLTGGRVAMGPGRRLGPARPYLGYIGEDRDLGRFVVRYPNATPIDRYALEAPAIEPVEQVGPVETPELAGATR